MHCWYESDIVWLRGWSLARTAYCALGFNQRLVLSGKSLTSSLGCWAGWLLKLRLHVGFSQKCSVRAWSLKSLAGWEWDWNSLWVSLCLWQCQQHPTKPWLIETSEILKRPWRQCPLVDPDSLDQTMSCIKVSPVSEPSAVKLPLTFLLLNSFPFF